MNLLYEETMARIKTVSRTQTQTELAKLLEVSQSRSQETAIHPGGLVPEIV